MILGQYPFNLHISTTFTYTSNGSKSPCFHVLLYPGCTGRRKKVLFFCIHKEISFLSVVNATKNLFALYLHLAVSAGTVAGAWLGFI